MPSRSPFTKTVYISTRATMGYFPVFITTLLTFLIPRQFKYRPIGKGSRHGPTKTCSSELILDVRSTDLQLRLHFTCHDFDRGDRLPRFRLFFGQFRCVVPNKGGVRNPPCRLMQ
jgi:hypothetical protein